MKTYNLVIKGHVHATLNLIGISKDWTPEQILKVLNHYTNSIHFEYAELQDNNQTPTNQIYEK